VTDLKSIIAKNIVALRQGAKLTQSDLADKLSYSDKAISKWERAESMPDITVLKAIADLFELPLDYLVQEEHDTITPTAPVQAPAPSKRRNHVIITLLSVLIVWFLATVGFVTMDIASLGHWARFLAFLYALPISCIVWLVFNSIWFNSRWNYLIISLMMWSAIFCIVLTLFACGVNAWQILFLGIPGQAAVWLWSYLQYRAK
jgi:transcriptional regulator with XRE-family HTH domain